MHHEGGSWTAVRTHTPIKFSKVLYEPLAPIPLDRSKFRENGSQPPPNRTYISRCIRLSILEFLLSAGEFSCMEEIVTFATEDHCFPPSGYHDALPCFFAFHILELPDVMHFGIVSG